MKGNTARVPAYVDSAYFLLFNRTLQGILEGAADTNLANASMGNRLDGAAIQDAPARNTLKKMGLEGRELLPRGCCLKAKSGE